MGCGYKVVIAQRMCCWPLFLILHWCFIIHRMSVLPTRTEHAVAHNISRDSCNEAFAPSQNTSKSLYHVSYFIHRHTHKCTNHIGMYFSEIFPWFYSQHIFTCSTSHCFSSPLLFYYYSIANTTIATGFITIKGSLGRLNSEVVEQWKAPLKQSVSCPEANVTDSI